MSYLDVGYSGIAEQVALGCCGEHIHPCLVVDEERGVLVGVDFLRPVQRRVEERLGDVFLAHLPRGERVAQVGVLHIHFRRFLGERPVVLVQQVDHSRVLEELDIVHHRRPRCVNARGEVGHIERAGQFGQEAVEQLPYACEVGDLNLVVEQDVHLQ